MLQLVHDLRTPLGVAVGYLRLLRDHRLPDEADQQRAMTATADAVAAMSQLCQEASSFAATWTAGDQDLQMTPAAQLAEEVAKQLLRPMVVADADRPAGSVRARSDGATARAVAALLSRAVSTSGDTPSADIIVRVTDEHLNFLAGDPEQREAMLLGQRKVFDPWRAGPGLAVPLACLEVSQVSGQVFTDAASNTAIAVVLPLEMSA